MTAQELTQAVMDMRVDIAEISVQLKSALGSFEDFRQWSVKLEQLSGDMRALTAQLRSVQGRACDQERALTLLRDRPGKRWELLVTQLITLAAGALCAMALTQLGL